MEMIPLVLGALLGLVGIGLVFDAWAPDEIIVPQERRKRPRFNRDRWGEALVGLGVLSMAAAFMGRDTWRYSILTVIAGSVLLLWGVKRNAGYLKGVFTRADQSVPKVVEGARRIR
jgi:hypothetical protein